MRTIALFTLTTLVMVGCAATSTEVYTADGERGHSIDCSDSELARRSWSLCYERASELCGAGGYDILEKDSDESFSYGVARSMVILCKD